MSGGAEVSRKPGASAAGVVPVSLLTINVKHSSL